MLPATRTRPPPFLPFCFILPCCKEVWWEAAEKTLAGMLRQRILQSPIDIKYDQRAGFNQLNLKFYFYLRKKNRFNFSILFPVFPFVPHLIFFTFLDKLVQLKSENKIRIFPSYLPCCKRSDRDLQKDHLVYAKTANTSSKLGIKYDVSKSSSDLNLAFYLIWRFIFVLFSLLIFYLHFFPYFFFRKL